MVGPDPLARWPATYASWVDELPDRFREVVFHRWETVLAWGNRRHELDRAYAVIDNVKLQQLLLSDLPDGSIRRGIVRQVERPHHDWIVTLDDGLRLRSRVVIDASGGVGLVAPSQQGAAYQTAYGVRVPSDQAPLDLDIGQAILMDWRPLNDPNARFGGHATFLYVLDRGDGTRLVEETSLARTPGLPLEELRARLATRIGPDVMAIGRGEEVSIRMSSPSRSGSTSVCRFGAAGGFVNPVTGYSLATSLRRAPRVAAAIDDALGQNKGATVPSATIDESMWPRTARRTRALHDFGLQALLRLTPDECAQFFDAFFDLPTPVWSAYMSTETSARAVARAMRLLFAACPWRLRRRLAVLGPGLLLRALTG
jgi:lycopene beta-cyclase